MAQKHKKWEEWLTLSGETLSVVSYADYFAKRPLFSSLQVKNTCEVAAENLVLTIENNNGMLLPFEKAFEHIPFESTVKIELDNLLSPLYFASAEDIREEVVTATLKKDKKIVATASWTVTTLPFDFWQGTSGDVEQLAAFVRPRLGDCMKVRDEIAEQLKKWKTAGELQGYTGNDKNAVRHILAALFSTLRRNSIVRKNADISMPVELGAGDLAAMAAGEAGPGALTRALHGGSGVAGGFHPVAESAEDDGMAQTARFGGGADLLLQRGFHICSHDLPLLFKSVHTKDITKGEKKIGIFWRKFRDSSSVIHKKWRFFL